MLAAPNSLCEEAIRFHLKPNWELSRDAGRESFPSFDRKPAVTPQVWQYKPQYTANLVKNKLVGRYDAKWSS